MQRKFILILIIFLFVLSGCAPRLIKKAPPDTNIALQDKDVLVFGRIRWIQNGKERISYSSTFGWNIFLQVLRAEDMKEGTIKVEKDGNFFALLPMGAYIIHQLVWYDPWDGKHWLVPQVAFWVAGDQRNYYLGTLVVDIKTKRIIWLLGALRVKGVGLGIEDEENEAMEAFGKRYPDQEVQVGKALMVHDRSIPRFEELENMTVLLDVLRCLHFGVMPMLSP